jgi:hypothetical protein
MYQWSKLVRDVSHLNPSSAEFFCWLADCFILTRFTLNKDAISPSETLVTTYKTALCHNSEDNRSHCDGQQFYIRPTILLYLTLRSANKMLAYFRMRILFVALRWLRFFLLWNHYIQAHRTIHNMNYVRIQSWTKALIYHGKTFENIIITIIIIMNIIMSQKRIKLKIFIQSYPDVCDSSPQIKLTLITEYLN